MNLLRTLLYKLATTLLPTCACGSPALADGRLCAACDEFNAELDDDEADCPFCAAFEAYQAVAAAEERGAEPVFVQRGAVVGGAAVEAGPGAIADAGAGGAAGAVGAGAAVRCDRARAAAPGEAAPARVQPGVAVGAGRAGGG